MKKYSDRAITTVFVLILVYSAWPRTIPPYNPEVERVLSEVEATLEATERVKNALDELILQLNYYLEENHAH